MTKVKYQSALALKEHLLDGNAVSNIEAILLFGVQSPTRAFTQIKKEGFIVKSQKVPMAKIIRRVNEHTTCLIPKNLPYKEIYMMEYWISK